MYANIAEWRQSPKNEVGRKIFQKVHIKISALMALISLIPWRSKVVLRSGPIQNVQNMSDYCGTARPQHT